MSKIILALLIVLAVILFGPLGAILLAFFISLSWVVLSIGAGILVLVFAGVLFFAMSTMKKKKAPTDFPELIRTPIEGTELYIDQYKRKWRKTKSGIFKMC